MAPIKYAKHLVPDALDGVEEQFLEAGVPLFQMNGSLVEMIRLNATQAKAEAGSTGVRRKVGSLVIKPVGAHRLLELMLRHCTFATWNAQREKFVAPSAPPLDFARHFEARGMWNLRVLRGIVEAPVLRPDGSVVSEPGYDDASGLYVDTGGTKFPKVPEAPSRADAVKALAVIKDVIKDFPFVDDEASSVALAAILTPACRKSIPTAPALGFDAPTMSSGKTLLCDSVSLIWTGRPAVAISPGSTEEEFDKRIFSVLLQGDPIVMIDNVGRALKSDEYCKALTSETIQGRVLGASVNRQASTSVVWLMNGNNLVLEGDLRTRVLKARIDSHMENPGERTFDRDLRQWLPENRGMLVAACLTVLRAFVLAGKPGLGKMKPFGRFEAWSDLVRGALVWLGEADPYATHKEVAANDPEMSGLAMLIEAWGNAVEPGRWLTAAELITMANHDETRRLPEAIDTVSSRSSAKVLGKYLVGITDRIVADRCIRKESRIGYSTQFRLEAGQAGQFHPQQK